MGSAGVAAPAAAASFRPADRVAARAARRSAAIWEAAEGSDRAGMRAKVSTV